MQPILEGPKYEISANRQNFLRWEIMQFEFSQFLMGQLKNSRIWCMLKNKYAV